MAFDLAQIRPGRGFAANLRATDVDGPDVVHLGDIGRGADYDPPIPDEGREHGETD